MEVRILKGTNQIGGCITEITSDNDTKIIIDFGEDLPSEDQVKNEKLEIDGLTKGKSSYDAVFITHSHGDHIGLINEINNDIDVYVEKYSKIIHNITCDFTRKEPITRKTNTFSFNKRIPIKDDIFVTPYLVDHSSFNSCMFLIEADGKRILHTGDYRNHGRKGVSFESTLNEIGKIDALITEGTTFGRKVTKSQTEDELVEEAKQLFKKYDDVLVLQSSTNIDRIVSFYKAASSTKKSFVEDLFTATIASSIKKTIPSPTSKHRNVSVWIPWKYDKKSDDFKEQYINPMIQYKRPEAFSKNVCMIVKQSMLPEIKMLQKEKHKFKNACLIYSMWNGYLDDEKTSKFINEIEKMGITIEYLHTSGHADESAMKLVNDILKPNIVIPIHTDNKERAKEIFDTAIDVHDNEPIKI